MEQLSRSLLFRGVAAISKVSTPDESLTGTDNAIGVNATRSASHTSRIRKLKSAGRRISEHAVLSQEAGVTDDWLSAFPTRDSAGQRITAESREHRGTDDVASKGKGRSIEHEHAHPVKSTEGSNGSRPGDRVLARIKVNKWGPATVPSEMRSRADQGRPTPAGQLLCSSSKSYTVASPQSRPSTLLIKLPSTQSPTRTGKSSKKDRRSSSTEATVGDRDSRPKPQ